MPSQPPQPIDIRCFCRRSPLLAQAGRGVDGRGYVHVKAIRNGKMAIEVVVTEGTAHIRCKECLRWHNIQIVNGADWSKDGEQLPASVLEVIEAAQTPSLAQT